jgi:FkbM family methyltransferase
MPVVRNFIKKWLLSRDIILSRPPGQFNITEIKLAKAMHRGLQVRVALDGGAADGNWARQFKQIFPQAQVICVEPREDAQAGLAQLASEISGIHIAKTLLGEAPGVVEFFEHADQSSMLPGSTRGAFGKTVRAPVDTIDALVARLGLPSPDFIKLDLQGAELKALAGAREALKTANAVQLEVGLFAFQKGSPLIGDVMEFMKERGFRTYDILGLWHRPLDGALAQGDVLFIREGHPLVADSRWSAEADWS